jgi:flagellar motility protein MotE (MotC chaperone)
MEEPMRHQGTLASLLLLPLLVGGALAAEADRYKLEKSGSGWVRMDTQTGEMSICEERAGQLVCKLAADERAAFQEDVDRLLSSIKGLEDRVTALENSLTAKLERTLPTEEEFEKTMSYMERFFRGFIGIVKELDQEAPGEDPAKPKAQKT